MERLAVWLLFLQFYGSQKKPRSLELQFPIEKIGQED